eukprot:CAMPEP_0173380510 /NCGR_PEP_ID=MMETSP1356-20130122/3192_1 /TAXON_ID=77927 ORGANISM="Hemiselmis virescens, Strain PCC157" /NCGR_SAMPLE_ID=MMETSP1356 /ASSEMBLY_ACC=CAM_ASM_000847 /LENGTH=43 /DNA_ID= /DNA_START= /DNA_END= /DNA_ORIENTATION=
MCVLRRAAHRPRASSSAVQRAAPAPATRTTALNPSPRCRLSIG